MLPTATWMLLTPWVAVEVMAGCHLRAALDPLNPRVRQVALNHFQGRIWVQCFFDASSMLLECYLNATWMLPGIQCYPDGVYRWHLDENWGKYRLSTT